MTIEIVLSNQNWIFLKSEFMSNSFAHRTTGLLNQNIRVVYQFYLVMQLTYNSSISFTADIRSTAMSHEQLIYSNCNWSQFVCSTDLYWYVNGTYIHHSYHFGLIYNVLSQWATHCSLTPINIFSWKNDSTWCICNIEFLMNVFCLISLKK